MSGNQANIKKTEEICVASVVIVTCVVSVVIALVNSRWFGANLQTRHTQHTTVVHTTFNRGLVMRACHTGACELTQVCCDFGNKTHTTHN